MSKQAKIKCPHCGGQITVRQASGDEIPPDQVAAIWRASDKAFAAVDKAFAKLFDRKLWRL